MSSSWRAPRTPPVLRRAPRLSALRLAAIEAGLAPVHHHHRGGVTFDAQLRTLGEHRLRESIGLLGARLELGALFLHELALMLVEFRLLQQADRLQVTLDHIAEFGDRGGHVFAARLPVAAARIEHRLQFVDEEGRVAALAKDGGNDAGQRDDPLKMVEILRVYEDLEGSALFMRRP